MKRIFIILLVFIINACVGVTSKQIYLPSGEIGYNIDCSDTQDAKIMGIKMGWGKCYERASDYCQERGYTIVERTVDGKTTSGDVDIDIDITNKSKLINRSMLVKCN